MALRANQSLIKFVWLVIKSSMRFHTSRIIKEPHTSLQFIELLTMLLLRQLRSTRWLEDPLPEDLICRLRKSLLLIHILPICSASFWQMKPPKSKSNSWAVGSITMLTVNLTFWIKIISTRDLSPLSTKDQPLNLEWACNMTLKDLDTLGKTQTKCLQSNSKSLDSETDLIQKVKKSQFWSKSTEIWIMTLPRRLFQNRDQRRDLGTLGKRIKSPKSNSRFSGIDSRLHQSGKTNQFWSSSYPIKTQRMAFQKSHRVKLISTKFQHLEEKRSSLYLLTKSFKLTVLLPVKISTLRTLTPMNRTHKFFHIWTSKFTKQTTKVWNQIVSDSKDISTINWRLLIKP